MFVNIQLYYIKWINKFSFPIRCPSCGSKTVKEFNYTTKKKDAVTRCPDTKFNCKEILREKLKHFVSKDALNIEGLGKKVEENFWEKKSVQFGKSGRIWFGKFLRKKFSSVW